MSSKVQTIQWNNKTWKVKGISTKCTQPVTAKEHLEFIQYLFSKKVKE